MKLSVASAYLEWLEPLFEDADGPDDVDTELGLLEGYAAGGPLYLHLAWQRWRRTEEARLGLAEVASLWLAPTRI